MSDCKSILPESESQLAAFTERFFRFVDKQGCWNWTGCKNAHGYGRVGLQGKVILAHRVSYELHYGLVGNNCVLHRCDNTSCVNPEHLFLGTQADNMKDMSRKGRHAFGERPRGSGHGMSKLTEPDVVSIRELRESGVTFAALAKRFKVSVGTICFIVARQTWRHV